MERAAPNWIKRRQTGHDAQLHATLQRLAARLVPEATGIEALQQLSGGASQQTWAFDVTAASGRVPLILRRAAPGKAERSRMTVGLVAEARLIAAARDAGVPVPAVRHVLGDGDALGSGFVMERLHGETLGRREHRARHRATCPRRALRAGAGSCSARPRATPPQMVEMAECDAQHLGQLMGSAAPERAANENAAPPSQGARQPSSANDNAVDASTAGRCLSHAHVDAMKDGQSGVATTTAATAPPASHCRIG